MLVATCVLKLQLYGVSSLKEKRQIVKSLLVRLPRQFNVAVAEIDHHQVWGTTEIGLVTVGNDADYLQGLLQQSVNWLQKTRPDVVIERYAIEFR